MTPLDPDMNIQSPFRTIINEQNPAVLYQAPSVTRACQAKVAYDETLANQMNKLKID